MSQSRSLISAAILAATTVVGLAPASAAEFVVRTTTVVEMKAVFGQVESRTVVPARARIGGTIREIRVSEGNGVKEGDLIAVVHDSGETQPSKVVFKDLNEHTAVYTVTFEATDPSGNTTTEAVTIRVVR